jgi:hypothetical protein
MRKVPSISGYVKTVMVNNSTNINRHSLKHKKGGQHHLMLEMQVMAWDRINDGVRKNALQQGTPMTTPSN